MRLKHDLNWGRHFSRFKYCDAKLTRDGSRFIPVHRTILASVSTKFESLFDSNCDSSNPLVVEDVDFNSLEKVINFIYSGEIYIGDHIEDDLVAEAMENLKLDLTVCCETKARDTEPFDNNDSGVGCANSQNNDPPCSAMSKEIHDSFNIEQPSKLEGEIHQDSVCESVISNKPYKVSKLYLRVRKDLFRCPSSSLPTDPLASSEVTPSPVSSQDPSSAYTEGYTMDNIKEMAFLPKSETRVEVKRSKEDPEATENCPQLDDGGEYVENMPLVDTKKEPEEESSVDDVDVISINKLRSFRVQMTYRKTFSRSRTPIQRRSISRSKIRYFAGRSKSPVGSRTLTRRSPDSRRSLSGSKYKSEQSSQKTSGRRSREQTRKRSRSPSSSQSRWKRNETSCTRSPVRVFRREYPRSPSVTRSLPQQVQANLAREIFSITDKLKDAKHMSKKILESPMDDCEEISDTEMTFAEDFPSDQSAVGAHQPSIPTDETREFSSNNQEYF